MIERGVGSSSSVTNVELDAIATWPTFAICVVPGLNVLAHDSRRERKHDQPARHLFFVPHTLNPYTHRKPPPPMFEQSVIPVETCQFPDPNKLRK